MTTRDYRDEQGKRMKCGDCGRPTYYDYGDERYHHATRPEEGCFLIPAQRTYKWMPRPNQITTEEDVAHFFHLLYGAGINFHPDTRADEYETPLPARYDRCVEKCFAIGERDGFDVYEVALDVQKGYIHVQRV